MRQRIIIEDKDVFQKICEPTRMTLYSSSDYHAHHNPDSLQSRVDRAAHDLDDFDEFDAMASAANDEDEETPDES